MGGQEKINYVEFPSSDMEASKKFFTTVFGWRFEDYGPDYSAFFDAGIDGGFYRVMQQPGTALDAAQGAALIVLYSGQLEKTQVKVEAAGGQICKPVFTFPGGRRFHFIEPGGNELAVWSDKGL